MGYYFITEKNFTLTCKERIWKKNCKSDNKRKDNQQLKENYEKNYEMQKKNCFFFLKRASRLREPQIILGESFARPHWKVFVKKLKFILWMAYGLWIYIELKQLWS